MPTSWPCFEEDALRELLQQALGFFPVLDVDGGIDRHVDRHQDACSRMACQVVEASPSIGTLQRTELGWIDFKDDLAVAEMQRQVVADPAQVGQRRILLHDFGDTGDQPQVLGHLLAARYQHQRGDGRGGDP